MTAEPSSILCPLGDRSIVLVGLMGAGKSAVGRRLAKRLNIRFVDADEAIAEAAGMPVPDIFATYGEKDFRDGERKVILRLLEDGPIVLATGGGAFVNPEIRRAIGEKGVSVWIRADLETLFERCSRKGGRPLLETENPKETLKALMDERYPVYEKADMCVDSQETSADATMHNVAGALRAYLKEEAISS